MTLYGLAGIYAGALGESLVWALLVYPLFWFIQHLRGLKVRDLTPYLYLKLVLVISAIRMGILMAPI